MNIRKNSCLTNDPIIFVISEDQCEKVENHSCDLNISTGSNKELGVEAFQARLKEQKAKGRLMKGYSIH
ncbi:hypothetical protein [Prochlorococcus marinus]|uniref:hypothetical protein n=1 Tax=Prochlorococcus marinus TaxID=1219 RepID=UPI000DA1688A|nr:hypothetical protein [Prochlorococcus marinus]